ncbi:hypothetical protein H8356DRAFT_1315554 [Neocallimastix lanati (nom. inval.)]|uniref:AAA-ATPase-like domain-containing protein n=1 Tax=Neocallimastix californiae TaxID=1754190 RepID=A0A1Y2AF68_9FUNG|nr:hypothetical protein H8356DRAFT_1315554 [Neocallimastix sp. JGI-2020a]ORY20920.1 hypothetical protein LY90DRAFT_676488 [Neocallimastix californiae]|eukprot:ORY20920.1 hypothetical protein LY90DRAFT_676488 [Neocallimastix californiae]
MERTIYNPDKTNLIMELNKSINSNMKYFCVTLPRNFGKTMIVNMLVAYYSFTESKITVFDDKKISKNEGWDNYLGKYNVILLNNLNYFLKGNVTEGIEKIKKSIIDDVKMYDKRFKCDENEDIDVIIKKIYKSTHRKIVLIIDEWDLVLRDESRDTNSKNDYLNFLTLLIKNNENIVLTCITGILPIQNYNLNSYYHIDFIEFSMKTPGWMAKYIGINKDEAKELCQTHLANKTFNLSNKKQRLNNGTFIKIDKNEQISEKLSHKNENEKVNDEEPYKAIEDFYNGYQLIDKYSGIKYEIYSPYSIIKAIKEEHVKNNQSENKEILYGFIQNNFQNLKYVISLLIKQKSINIDSLKFQNDEISFEKRKSNLFLLVHYGYLGYNSSKNEIFIPNKEILELFKFLIESEIWKNLNKSTKIFNPGENNYSEFFKNDYVVDKTELILHINKIINSNITKNICVTRPRRFGKTVTVKMLVAYYSFTESKITVFDDKKISKNEGWDEYLGKYNVILLNNLNYFLESTIHEGIEKIKKSIIDDVKMYDKHFECDKKENIKEIIKKIYESTHRKIVLIIDEWDLVFRDPKKDKESKIEYLNFLTLLIKDNQNIILTYMTGILPIKSYELNSGLRDDNKELCKKYLNKEILDYSYETQISIRKNDYDEKDMVIATNYEMIKKWYNGYRLINQNDAIENKKIGYYWIKTETYGDLIDYIFKDIKGLKEDIVILMNQEKLKINIDPYINDVNTKEYTNKNEILTTLIHLGYLAYDSKNSNIYIPNKEIIKEFEIVTERDKYEAIFKIINESEKHRIEKKKYNKVYNDENTLQTSIINAYIFARVYYTIIPEVDSGKGYADVFFIPIYNNKPAMIVELKYNKTTNTGIKQIKNRNYPARLQYYKDNLLLISINYDNEAKNYSKNFKHHTYNIEKYNENNNKIKNK